MAHGSRSALAFVGLLSLVAAQCSAQGVPPVGYVGPQRATGAVIPRRQVPPGYQGRGVLRRLPPVEPERPHVPNQYIPPSRDPRFGPPPQTAPAEGATVRGRLSDRGRPLVKCRVAIVRIRDAADRYQYAPPDAERPLFTATTDEDGEYAISGVPRGNYKLTWLPAGTRQWIRRISLRPDVRVRDSKDVWLKEIRVATHTVN